MQLLKRPFYYNVLKLNDLTKIKILNYEYYPKFLICDSKYIDLGIKKKKTRKLFKNLKKKRKKRGKKKTVKLQFKTFLNEIYLDTFNFIEFLEDDFFYQNRVKYKLGFSYKCKTKYFSNTKILNHDFKEKCFSLNYYKNYLTTFYKNLKFISLKNKHKSIIPLQPKKNGFVVFGFGILGVIKKLFFQHITKTQLYLIILKSFYTLPTFTFFWSKLKIKFRKRGKKHPKLRQRLKFSFSKN